jgi:NitT/TauT family transport system ATP-binding protein
MDIIIQNLTVRFPSRTVLDGFSARLPEGKVTCLSAPSGWGKTTLLRVLMGLQAPDGGTITGLENVRIGAVFQEDRLCGSLSAAGNVRVACGKRHSREEITRALSAVGLDGASRQPVQTLSGGMKRRVALVRAVLAENTLLLLDEPFKGLDTVTRARVCDWLRGALDGRTVLLVTHDPEDVRLMGGALLAVERRENP